MVCSFINFIFKLLFTMFEIGINAVHIIFIIFFNNTYVRIIIIFILLPISKYSIGVL